MIKSHQPSLKVKKKKRKYEVPFSNEYEYEYLHLTQAVKSASISSVAQIGNAPTCLSHSSRPWILDSRASDHLSGNKDLFSSLTIKSPLPMITIIVCIIH